MGGERKPEHKESLPIFSIAHNSCKDLTGVRDLGICEGAIYFGYLMGKWANLGYTV